MADALTDRELQEIERAKASGRPAVVFVHGLWLLSSSWDPWRGLFEEAGYSTIAPGWPDDPETVEAARAHSERFAGKGVGAVTAHFAAAIGRLEAKPAVVGHSFGGLVTQKLAGMGLAAVSVAIDPAPFRGVLPLPLSALRAAFPVIGNPANYKRSVMLSYDQFRFAFANAVPEAEARSLYATFPVPGSDMPLFQAALANLNPRSETAVDTLTSRRGPMKLVSGQRDNTVPWSITSASFKKQKRNVALTQIEEIPGRGHSLVIDSGWKGVAEVALDFVRTHLAP